MDGMDNLLMTYRDMTTRDWLVDAVVALAAFAVGCLQLMLTASSIIVPDLALRQYLGVVNVVPDLQVFVGLGMTVVPLVLRRRFPLPVFAACLVIFLGLQVRFSGFSMTVVGPLVAHYTVAAECGTVPGVACGAAAVLGTMLSIKPILDVNAEGKLAVFDKVQGRKRALKALVDRMEACTRKPDAYPVFITYADCREDALLLAAMVRERFHVEIAHMNDMGPIIGGHAGPGTLALVFVSDEEKK